MAMTLMANGDVDGCDLMGSRDVDIHDPTRWRLGLSNSNLAVKRENEIGGDFD